MRRTELSVPSESLLIDSIPLNVFLIYNTESCPFSINDNRKLNIFTFLFFYFFILKLTLIVLSVRNCYKRTLLRIKVISAEIKYLFCPPAGSIRDSHVRGEILRSWEDELLRKHSTRMCSLIKNESVGIEDDQIPS